MRLLKLAAAGLVLVCIAVAGGAFNAHRQAKMLLDGLKHLDTSAEPSAAFRVFREQHRNQLVHEQCNQDICTSEFQVNNWVVSILHISPRAELHVWITLFHQKLSTAGVDYTSATFKQDSPVVHVQEDFCAERNDIPCNQFALNPHGCNVAQTWNGDIEFGQLATDAQKAAAWRLNLGCLTALQGCKDISQLSPEVWRIGRSGSVSTRMRSTADSIAEASQSLCQ